MENIKIDDFCNYKMFSKLNYSPDGKNICFVVKKALPEDNKYSSNLWIYRIEDNSYFQLTSFNEESSYLWIDNDTILFNAVRDPKDKDKQENGEEFTQYYKININGGEALPAFRIPKNVSDIKQAYDNKYLFTSSYDFNRPELDELTGEAKEGAKKQIEEEKDYLVFDEIPFWFNGAGVTNKKRSHLFLFDTESDTVTDLTDILKDSAGEYMNISLPELDKSGTKAVFTSESYKDKMKMTNDLFIVDLKDMKAKKISPYKDFDYDTPYFIDDNTIIFSGSDGKQYGINQNSTYFILDLNTGKITSLNPNYDNSNYNMVNSDCRLGTGRTCNRIENGYLYFLSTDKHSSVLRRIGRNGTTETIISYEGSVDDYDIKDGIIYFIGFRENKLQEIYRFENGVEHQITTFNKWVNDTKNISTPEHISFINKDGIEIEGWIMKPVNFNPKSKYPAILNIHGGPKTAFGSIFVHEMQYWVNEGYAVFFCNPRGSDGRGNDFANVRGKYGTIDYDDIMEFTDYIVKNYKFIDENRIGVTGGSYGGWMVNWIIGHTNRFKCAVSQRSISNWISMFGISDIGYYFTEDQNDIPNPWDDFNSIWNFSPIKYADKVKTPTLFIHSREDYRCPEAEGIQMFTALKYFGIESRICLFKGENHELSRGGKPKHRIRRLKEMTDWFDKYLKK